MIIQSMLKALVIVLFIAPLYFLPAFKNNPTAVIKKYDAINNAGKSDSIKRRSRVKNKILLVPGITYKNFDSKMVDTIHGNKNADRKMTDTIKPPLYWK